MCVALMCRLDSPRRYLFTAHLRERVMRNDVVATADCNFVERLRSDVSVGDRMRMYVGQAWTVMIKGMCVYNKEEKNVLVWACCLCRNVCVCVCVLND